MVDIHTSHLHAATVFLWNLRPIVDLNDFSDAILVKIPFRMSFRSSKNSHHNQSYCHIKIWRKNKNKLKGNCQNSIIDDDLQQCRIGMVLVLKQV